MSNADTTERRLLASIRKAKGEDDAPAPRPRRTAAPRAASKPARIPATSPRPRRRTRGRGPLPGCPTGLAGLRALPSGTDAQ